MYAKQYEITLPADYDMRTVRRRVADASQLLNHRPGLGLKAYVIRERGVDGAGDLGVAHLGAARGRAHRRAGRRPPPLGVGQVPAVGGRGARG